MKVLHAGCGGDRVPEWLAHSEETRLDIDEQHQPDVVASITDMGAVGPFDAVYCSHCLEHLPAHEVGVALREFLRVLRPGGVACVIVPNLEGIAPDESVVYQSAAGPITGRDMYYGHADLSAKNPYMAHKTGFVPDTLRRAFMDAGFMAAEARGDRAYNLICIGVKANGDGH
jgi:SAM-dependent methyltransferase